MAFVDRDTYVVEAGDTLWRLSRRYRVPLRTLIDINRLEQPNLIYPGQVLTIPGGGEVRTRTVPFGTLEHEADQPSSQGPASGRFFAAVTEAQLRADLKPFGLSVPEGADLGTELVLGAIGADVTGVSLRGRVLTVTVRPRRKGHHIIEIKRSRLPKGSLAVVFTTADGHFLDAESVNLG